MQASQQLLDASSLVMHLLLRVLLEVKLLLELIKLGPELPLIVLYVRPIALKSLNLVHLLTLFGIDPRQVLVKLRQFPLQSLSLLRLLGCIIPFQLCALQLQVLLELLQLLAVGGPLLLLLHNLVVELVQDLVEAVEADRVFDLQTALLRDVALDQIAHQQISVCLLAHLREDVEVLVLDLAGFRDATADLVRLHVSDVVKVGRVFESQLIIESVVTTGGDALIVVDLLQDEWLLAVLAQSFDLIHHICKRFIYYS